MTEFFRKIRWLVERRRKEAELRDELQFHLDEEAEERRAQGLPEQEARIAARQELGNLGLLREDVRTAWGWTIVTQFAQDLRYTFRMVFANKLFSLLAILSLALGIGANTAIFSFMDSILVRSLPVSNPESLAMLNWHAKRFQWGSFVMHGMNGSTYDSKAGTTAGILPFPAFQLFQKADSVFSAVFAHRHAENLNVAVKKGAFLASGEYVSGDYFRGLGVPPEAGRLIIPADDRIGAPAVAVLSYGFNERCFGSPADAVGQRILINNVPFIVAGVAPPGFFGVDPAAAPDVFLPLHSNLVVEGVSQHGARAEDYLDQNY
jgi:macrolide transport system ATP-binding/permease protein